MSADVRQRSPRPALTETTAPSDGARRSAAAYALAIAAVPDWTSVAGSRMTRMAAPGAMACTISASPASSPLAWYGEAAPANWVRTCKRAAGRPKRLS